MKTNVYLFAVLIFLIATLVCNSIPAHAQLATSDISTSQRIPDTYARPIEGGKHRLYFTFDYSLTKTPCASIFREVKFNQADMTFEGPFKDMRADGSVIAEGFYRSGYLDSTLVIRYLNGNIWQKGAYKDGKMHGTWEYFFPDGKPMYTLTIKGNSIFINTVWDIDGKVLVKKGKGNAVIYQYDMKSVLKESTFSWRGKVKKGMIFGTWMAYKDREPMNVKQIYSKGKFVNGFYAGKFYNTVNYFTVEQDQAILNAELLAPGECDENRTNDTPPLYPSGDAQLKQDVYKEMRKLSRPFPDVCIIEVSFDVDAEGKLSEFRGESNTGVELPLIEILKELGPWLPATKEYEPVAQRKTYSLYFVNRHMEQRARPEDLSDIHREEIKLQNEIKQEPVQWKKVQ